MNEKYSEDRSDRQINNHKLNNMFDINKPNQEVALNDEISELVKESKKSNPDDIILKNIERAEMFLDKIEESITDGASARIFEVAGQLINAITTAASSLIGNSEHSEEIEIKKRALALKERETVIKESLGKNKEGEKAVTNNQIILTNREDLIKLMGNEDK